jgi:hypothetical protein
MDKCKTYFATFTLKLKNDYELLHRFRSCHRAIQATSKPGQPFQLSKREDTKFFSGATKQIRDREQFSGNINQKQTGIVT